jgi:hypothetical protein
MGSHGAGPAAGSDATGAEVCDVTRLVRFLLSWFDPESFCAGLILAKLRVLAFNLFVCKVSGVVWEQPVRNLWQSVQL